MKNILNFVLVDVFIPFNIHLAKYLENFGYETTFLTFLPREHLILKKNNVNVVPENVYSIRTYDVKNALFSTNEIEEILGFHLLKLGGSRSDWRDRLMRTGSFLDDLLSNNKFDAVFVWNGEDFLGKALTILARRRGIKIIYGENGYFPKTLQFDSRGVNVHSSITQLSFSEMCESLELGMPELDKKHSFEFSLIEFKSLNYLEFLKCFIKRKTDFCYYKYFPEQRGNSWFISQWVRIKKYFVPLDKVVLPDKYIFIPFQVHDDTQVLLNSRHFKKMEDFFECTYKAIKRKFGNEFSIVVKEHPEDLGRYSYAGLHKKYPDVLWLRKYDIDKLIENASYVFVVNSSVGLQAIQKFKPTVIFGESFYTRDEIAFSVNDLSDLDKVIGLASQGINEARKHNIVKFVKYLQERFFVISGWKNVTASGIANAGNKIVSLIEK